jgi:predicted lipid-binding transport protein (Tim44 family)
MKRIFLTVLVALTLAFAGAGDALAKAGSTSKSSGGSMGSKGSRTHEAAPMERTLTPPTASTAPRNTVPPPPQAAPRPGAVDSAPLAPAGVARPGAIAPAGGMAAQPPGFFQRNPFMAGLAGGLVGAGIGGMLFGHSPALAAAGESAPGAGMLGLLLQLLLIGGLVWLAVRMFRRRPAEAGPANPYARETMPGQHIEPQFGGPAAATPAIAAPRVAQEFQPSETDQQAFTEILLGVQKAWSDGDLAGLRRWATPEVVMFLSEDLSRNTSEGLMNKVENVELLNGDVSESWSENGFDYLTAILTFQCQDYMVRVDTGAIANGNRTNPVQHTESWTFARASGSGRWLLSAVEQM